MRTWIEVSKDRLRGNYRLFRSLVPRESKLMAVVKSNAYGHGLVDFSKAAARLGADWLGVDSVVEGLALRKEGVRIPILVMGYTLPEMLPAARRANIVITVSSFEALREAARGPKGLRIHLKIDSGMHRQGFLLSDLGRVRRELKKLKGRLALEGLYTHFAAAKNPAFPDYTRRQLEVFGEWRAVLARDRHLLLHHAAATGAALLFPETHLDMVRIGAGFYGLWPSPETRAALEERIKLRPILSWKTTIAELKEVEGGAAVGYDLTERLRRSSKLAVVPVGYWHGLPRSLSSVGYMSVRGKRARIVSRISMGMTILDVTNIAGVRVGDEVVVLGNDGKTDPSADELARLADTIPYEIVARINPLIKKFYI